MSVIAPTKVLPPNDPSRANKVTVMMPIYDSTRQLIQGTAHSGSSDVPLGSAAAPLFGWTAPVACLVTVQSEMCSKGFNVYAIDKDDADNSHGVLVYSNGRSEGGTYYTRGTGTFFLSPGDKVILCLDPGGHVDWWVNAYPLKAVQIDIA